MDNQFSFKGIMQPALKYRFSAHFMLPNNQALPSLSVDLEYINYDLKSKLGEFFTRIPIYGNVVMADLNDICQNDCNIMISIHDGTTHVTFNVYLTGVTILECPISHEYAVSDMLGAKVKFKYESIQFFIPESEPVS